MDIILTDEETDELIKLATTQGGAAGFDWLEQKGKVKPSCPSCQKSQIITWIAITAMNREQNKGKK